MNIALILGAVLFVGSIIYTFVRVNQATGSSENKKEMQSAINTVLIVNSIMTFVLGGIAMTYISANPVAERPYILTMLHLSLLLSIIAVSVVVLQKVDLATTTTT